MALLTVPSTVCPTKDAQQRNKQKIQVPRNIRVQYTFNISWAWWPPRENTSLQKTLMAQ